VADIKCDLHIVQIDTLTIPAAFLAALIASSDYENSPHGLGSRAEEVTATIPVVFFVGTNHTEECLMHQRGGRSLFGKMDFE
jgi:hypothetical protein